MVTHRHIYVSLITFPPTSRRQTSKYPVTDSDREMKSPAMYMDDSLHDPIPGCFVSGWNLPEPPFFNPTTTVHDQATHACRRLSDISFTQVPLTSLSGAEFVKAWLEVVKLMHSFGVRISNTAIKPSGTRCTTKA